MLLTLILCRFGSFEIFRTRDSETGRVGPSVGRGDILHQLLDFVTQSYYPKVTPQAHESGAVVFYNVCVYVELAFVV